MQKEFVQKIQKHIFSWYKKYGRHDLPWRATDDIYHIVVSEIMLQQTNVPKVIEKYNSFIKIFPTIEDLANAAQKDVVLQWQGLGYNRRALYLKKMAESIAYDFGGEIPHDSDKLIALPGIGPYTSRSILIFAYNENIATWDVNIVRVLRRVHGEKIADNKKVDKWCQEFLPHNRSRDWHNALMDFASLICTKRTPKCESCPLKMVCRSYPDPDDFVYVKRKEIGRSEKGKHIPRRIYRGRIIEFLRHQSGTIDEIGCEIKSDWIKTQDQKWCEDVLRGLEKDEMIMCKNDRWMLQ